jgi:hypothetical protein
MFILLYLECDTIFLSMMNYSLLGLHDLPFSHFHNQAPLAMGVRLPLRVRVAR